MSTIQSATSTRSAASPRSGAGGLPVTAALVAGPLLVLGSALLDHAPAGQDAADVLAAVRAHRGDQLAEVLLEMSGLSVLLAGAAASALRIRGRGARLAVLGAVGCVLGIVGFTMVDTEGLVVNALAGMSQQDAAGSAAEAVTSSPAVYVAFPLIMLGELGLVGVLAAWRRAGLLPVWPAVLAFASLVVDFSGGNQVLLVVSDVLVLAAAWWLAAATSSTGQPAG